MTYFVEILTIEHGWTVALETTQLKTAKRVAHHYIKVAGYAARIREE